MAETVYGDRWKITESLGEGGQAHTYKVHDLKGNKEVPFVLKRLKNKNRIERFKAEVTALRLVQHANVIKIVDFDLDAAKPYLVMEFAAGGDLTSAKPFWRNSSVRTLELFLEICAGVSEAHKNEILHRDIKPSNVLLRREQGPAVVADFGLCLVLDSNERFTATNEAVGPRWYMAPEFEDGIFDNASPAADVYSLGKLLYWLFTGKIFSRENHREPKWDLKQFVPHPFLEENYPLEHIARLLDKMIVNDEECRISLEEVTKTVHQTIRLFVLDFNPVSPTIPQRCRYCGLGTYAIEESGSAYNFGFQTVGKPDWRILVCSRCGHCELFRLDLILSADEWWKKRQQ